MAWNEPGGNKEKDPWNSGDQGPPDLDEAFRKFKQKFGGGKNNGNSGSGGSSGLPPFNAKLFILLIVAIAVIWGLLGIYQVDQQERGVVLRFGKYYENCASRFKLESPAC